MYCGHWVSTISSRPYLGVKWNPDTVGWGLYDSYLYQMPWELSLLRASSPLVSSPSAADTLCTMNKQLFVGPRVPHSSLFLGKESLAHTMPLPMPPTHFLSFGEEKYTVCWMSLAEGSGTVWLSPCQIISEAAFWSVLWNAASGLPCRGVLQYSQGLPG